MPQSLKHCLNSLHGQKEPFGLGQERLEVALEIEASRARLGIHNNGPRSNMPRPQSYPLKSVKKKMFTQALPLQRLCNGHASEQRDREGKPR